MNFTDINGLIRQAQDKLYLDFPFLVSWQVTFDNAKKRAGSCKMSHKVISISKHHILNNDRKVVMDTVLHEYAHAIAFELYGDTAHGKKWKETALLIGAKANVTGLFSIPEAPWLIVTYCEKSKTVQKIADRFRKNKNIKNFYLKNKLSTKGKLFFLCRNEYSMFISGKLKFELLNFIQ